MTVSIGEKKRVGGAAPPIVRLEEYRQCRGVTQVVSELMVDEVQDL